MDATLVLVALISLTLSLLGFRSTQLLDMHAVNPTQGNAFSIDLPGSRLRLLHLSDDSNARPKDSALSLYEDHQRLGPPHTLHADVVNLGAGRFSHWNGTLIFSASDNTDPRTNGRIYEIECNWRVAWTITTVLWLAVIWRLQRPMRALIAKSRRTDTITASWVSRAFVRRAADATLIVAAVVALAMSSFGWPSMYPLNVIDITPSGGYAFTDPQPAPPASMLSLADDSAKHPSSSLLALYEGGKSLGPAHSLHADIHALGGGRYSHWDGAVIFSTSDNSDPRTNGHEYRMQCRWQLSWLITAPVLAMALWRQRRPVSAASMQIVRWSRRLFAQPADASEGTATLKSLFVYPYLALYLVFVAAGSFWWGSLSYYRPQPIAGADQQLQNRFAYYEDHRDDFNLIFLGDSRTYCGMHPERIDPLLGTRSINLSSFSNWFPTQLAEVKRLVKAIPKDTTVVLTTGHINFSCIGNIQRVFPIDIPTALHYQTLDIPRTGLWDNVAFYNPYLYFWAVRGEIRERFLGWAQKPVTGVSVPTVVAVASNSFVAAALAAPASPDQTTVSSADPPLLSLSTAPFANVLTPNITRRATLPADVERLVREYASDSNVTLVDLNEDNGHITSLVVYYKGGGYYRIEVDHAFFREKQRTNPQSPNLAGPVAEPSPKIQAPPPAPACLALFSEMLDVFQQNGVELIVNEIEEAPYTYRSEENRRAFREVMQTTVRPVVEAHGFRYVTTELGQLEDADYFDYNHLNSQGIEKYTPMLADALRPLLSINSPKVHSPSAVQ